MRTTSLDTRNPPLTSLASMGIWVSFSKGERKKSHEYTAPTQLATRLLQYHSTKLVLSSYIVRRMAASARPYRPSANAPRSSRSIWSLSLRKICLYRYMSESGFTQLDLAENLCCILGSPVWSSQGFSTSRSCL